MDTLIIISGKLINKYDSWKFRRNRRKRKNLKKGLPEGITFETLNDLCRRYIEDTLSQVSYLQLSGWKTFGAYRLILETDKNRHWSLIYKNDIYKADNIPALEGLPVLPGPPEYNIYNNSKLSLSRYLPHIYLCEELIPKKHYKYILEDAGIEYQKASNEADSILSLVTKLSSIHEAMSRCGDAINNDYMLQYDYNYAKALDRYIWKNLEQYQSVYYRRTGDEAVSEVCKIRDKISEMRLRSEFYERQNFRPIHGDFHPSNILIHKKDPDRIKLIDWEWAGIGLAHSDVATLLQGTSPSLEQQALKVFIKNNRHLRLKENCRLYQFCKMERGLINAAYVIALNMESPDKIRLHPGIIKRSMLNVLQAYDELAFN